MAVVDRLSALLPREAAQLLKRHGGGVTEVRLRAGRPVQLVGAFGERLSEERLGASELGSILAALMDYSLYARQEELDRGFFTLDDGSRVGVCGHVYAEAGRSRMGQIGSVCVRVARAIPGCADCLMGEALPSGAEGPRSMLILSPPGLGKTTLLRDAARQLSHAGYCVGLADERHELAACHDGTPALDVGPRTDVMDGCPRPEAIRRLLRSMSPSVIVADEVGGEADAEALADAVRCGAAVIASAHAGSLGDALRRPPLKAILGSGVVRHVAVLGPTAGALRELWRDDGIEEGESIWRRA